MTVMLLEWVLTSAFLIIVVLALRAALGKRVSARLRYALWGVVLVRLLVPVQLFSSPLAGTRVFSEDRTEQIIHDVGGLLPSHGAGEDEALDALGGQDGQTAALTTVPHVPDAPTAPDAPEPPAAPDLTKAPAWLGWVWLAGSIMAALVLLVSNLRFYWRLRRCRIHLEGADCLLPVYVAVGLPSPCLFGVVRPAVYVTPEAAADPDMLRHVLAHEHTHYRHGDHIWSLLRCAALAVHWWDPLVWTAAALSQRDAELACDEGALKRLGDGERAKYGATLLALVTAKPRPGDLFRCATTMAGDKKSLKERISRIACAPKRILWAAVAVVLVTALACVCAFGQAAEEPEDDVDEFAPAYVMSESGTILVEGLGDAYVEWGRGTNGGSLYLAGDMAYFCPKLAGESTEGGAYWEDGKRNGKRSILSVHLAVDDDRIQDGAVGGFGISFTVDLDSDTVTWREFTSMMGDRAIELTDQEMVDMARVAVKLLTEAEDYYNSETGGDEADLLSHFAVDNLDDVPEDVLTAIGAGVRESYEQFLDVRLGYFSWLSEDEMPQFDGWRVENLTGPYENDIRGVKVEIWRVNYEYHADDPVKAENLLVGGMYVTEDGWLCPTYSNCTYYIFLPDEQGSRYLAAVMMANDCAPDNGAAPERFQREVESALAMKLTGMPLQADLNRNGVPETLQMVEIDEGMGRRLELWEDDQLLWSEEGFYAHAGWTSVFLCTLDGQDHLLRYHPTMYGGACTYTYELFTLENGQETVVRENSVEFDINFQPWIHQSFDPEAIAAFMDEVNDLLAHSVQLLNTDSDLLPTFEKEGRLYDSLSWLDWWEPVFVRDESKSLLENLRGFQAAMEAEEWGDP